MARNPAQTDADVGRTQVRRADALVGLPLAWQPTRGIPLN